MNWVKSFSVCAVIALLESVVCLPAQAQFAGGDTPKKSTSKSGQPPVDKSLLSERSNPAKDEAAAENVCQCLGPGDSAAVRRIEQALRAPLLKNGLEFTDTPLKEVVDALQSGYGIPIQINAPALEEAGIGIDSPVTVNLHNISLHSALRLILKTRQLTYVIQDEVLLITTKEDAEAQLKICVYDVRRVTDTDDAAIKSLIDTIVSCVATDTWAKNGGGEAEIRSIKRGLLVISQTQAVHEQIRDLLSTIQTMRNDVSPNSNAGVPGPPKDDKVVTRSYLLQLNPTKDIDTMRSQVRDLITQSLPKETWSGQLDDGQAVTLTVFHDRIVVRHKPAVQEKLQKILADSGVATPAMSAAPVGAAPTFAPTFVPGGFRASGAPGIVVSGIAPGPGPEPSPPAGPGPGGPAGGAAGASPAPDSSEFNPFK